MADVAKSTPGASTSTKTTPENIPRVVSRGSLQRSVWRRRNVELRRRSRTFTPYQKTPKSRRIKGVANHQRTPPRATNTDHFGELLNKTWRVHKVSPLFGFQYDTKRFRQYSKLLSAFVITEQRKGEAVSVEECADQASFSVFRGLTACPDGPEAVKITLRKVVKRGKSKEAESTIVLTALLCCVQPLSAVSRAMGFTKLPVMLIKGPMALTRLLTSWLQMTFDCCVNVMSFSPLQLSWMVAMFAGDVLEKRNQPVQLMYSVPCYLSGLSKVTLDLDPHDCHRLWKSIHDEASDDFTEDEVTNFIKALEAHFFYYFKISLQGMPMSRIGTPTLYAGTDGRVKMYSPKHIKQVLRHFTVLALEQSLLR